MHPRCWLPRRRRQLEHNQCHGPYNFFPRFFFLLFSDSQPKSIRRCDIPDSFQQKFALPDHKEQTAIIPAMSAAQTWDPVSYARNARFVSDLGSPVVDLLAPKPGEKILDLGCGDGVLTKKLADLGCEVVAIDSSVPQIEAARKLGLNASAISGEDLPYKEEFDAVFSNAVLHWIRRADLMLAGVYRSLKPGGRFVAECGGHGCIHKIRTALVQALDRRGFDGEARVPWHFPTPGEYATRLERAGFRVDSIALIPRPSPSPGDIVDTWKRLPSIFFKASPTKLAATICRRFGWSWNHNFGKLMEPGWPTTYGCDSRPPKVATCLTDLTSHSN